MGEIHSTSTFDLARERLVVVNVGPMCRLRDNVILYANVGRSIVSGDIGEHIYIGVGLKLLPNE